MNMLNIYTKGNYEKSELTQKNLEEIKYWKLQPLTPIKTIEDLRQERKEFYRLYKRR